MTDNHAHSPTYMFVRPISLEGSPAGDWQPLGLFEGSITPSTAPNLDDDAPAFPALTVPGAATITMTFERGPGWDELIRMAAIADAVERSRAMARAVEHHAAVLAIAEDYRTTYIVTDMLEPLHLHVVRAEDLAAGVIGKRS